MHSQIITKIETARGCGYRKVGGKYLITDGVGKPCGKLPLPLTACPVCGEGIKPSRGWTWVNPKNLFGGKACSLVHCGTCSLSDKNIPERAGLLWIGVKHYPSPEQWIEEGRKMGFSRRINFIPRGFEVGKTLVLSAHRKAIPLIEGKATELGFSADSKAFQAGIFYAWVPQRIEQVVTGDESDEEIEKLLDRGIVPVKVVKK